MNLLGLLLSTAFIPSSFASSMPKKCVGRVLDPSNNNAVIEEVVLKSFPGDDGMQMGEAAYGPGFSFQVDSHPNAPTNYRIDRMNVTDITIAILSINGTLVGSSYLHVPTTVHDANGNSKKVSLTLTCDNKN